MNHNDSSSRSAKTKDIISEKRLVETELYRKKLYERLLESVSTWLFDRNARVRLTEMQIAHIVLRYVFNKKATISTSTSDPVFIVGTSDLARRQLSIDLKNARLEDSDRLADKIDDEIKCAVRELRFKNPPDDEQVTLSSETDGKLVYRGRYQEDFAHLAQRYGPKYYNAAYALGLRYSYVRLTGHGLARKYEEDTKRSSDDPFACECFASSFNHYFDRYHSAFEDLERWFGSRGSFFKIKWEDEPSNMTYYVCPPFDESLMQLCVDHVFDALKNHAELRPTFIFSIPGTWTNFSALEQLKASSWLQDFIDYPKGKLPFIDYMATREKDRIIYPTDICVLTLSTESTNDKASSPSRSDDDDNQQHLDSTTTAKSTRKRRFNETNDKDESKKIKLD
ncbi:unnamed protein product [Adineta ricciae]|uniref:PCIF1 WW domain-containing protein n=2 Tax=Adineta ricciae TaxID=249248 RepID=A0A813Z8P8_ADIRI|nr:unnamed protein product [Adineta ricciae]